MRINIERKLTVQIRPSHSTVLNEGTVVIMYLILSRASATLGVCVAC